MMTTAFKYIMRSLGILFFVFIFTATSCKKKNETTTGSAVISGDATVIGQVMHHTWSVPNCKVYIKKNCSSFPGRSPSLYNSYLTADGSGYISFDKLANGNYFFYAVGYDPAMIDTVWGYNSVVINNKPGETKEYDLIIPVSE